MCGLPWAAMVLVGLAAEDQTLSLCDAVGARLAQPNDPDAKAAWEAVRQQDANFAKRWKALLRLLEALKREVRRLSVEQRRPWEGVLEPVPWGIGGLGEAVRMARNSAAHDAEHVFTHAEVTLQVKAIPTQLAAVSSIERVLRDANVIVPAL